MERDDGFEALFRKYERRLYLYLVNVLKAKPPDAEDLVIETFQRYLEESERDRNARERRGEANWWHLRTIAWRLHSNSVRERAAMKRRSKVLSVDDLRPEPVAPEESDLPAIAHETARRIGDAYAKLPALKQQSLRLRMEGLTYTEIAELLDIPLVAVSTNLHAARKVIRESLDSNMPAIVELREAGEMPPIPQPARHLNVWLENADPPLRLDAEYRIGADIGAPHLDAVASSVFREPHWGDRDELRVVLVLTADHARVAPMSRRAVLPRIGNMRPVFFTIRALDAGNVRFRLDVVTEREGDVLESVSFVLEVVHAEKAVAR